MIVPVHQALDDRHLSLLELFLGKTASSVRKVNGVTDLNVICERDILHLNTVNYQISAFHLQCLTHSWVSHFPKSLTSWPSLEISFGSVVAVAILKDVDLRRCWWENVFNDEQRVLLTIRASVYTCYNLKIKVWGIGYFRTTIQFQNWK